MIHRVFEFLDAYSKKETPQRLTADQPLEYLLLQTAIKQKNISELVKTTEESSLIKNSMIFDFSHLNMDNELQSFLIC